MENNWRVKWVLLLIHQDSACLHTLPNIRVHCSKCLWRSCNWPPTEDESLACRSEVEIQLQLFLFWKIMENLQSNSLLHASSFYTNLPNRSLTSWNWYISDYGDHIFMSKAWKIKIWHNPQAGTNCTLLRFKRFRRTFKCIILANTFKGSHLRDTWLTFQAATHYQLQLQENKRNI